MSGAFVIMQIGNPDLDRVFETVFVPAIQACGLGRPVRIDIDSNGGLLKAEITDQIRSADIILADLTNERPNCYLEVGYAMGAGRQQRLILCAREDHRPDRPGREDGDPKVHFDASGYQIIYWSPSDLPGLERQLSERVRRRLSNAANTGGGNSLDDAWATEMRAGAGEAGGVPSPSWELLLGSRSPLKPVRSRDLLAIADAIQVHQTGWPIGVVIHRAPLAPQSRPGAIVADLTSEEDHCDYWGLATSGRFFHLRGTHDGDEPVVRLSADWVVWRAAESLLYAGRLYRALDASPDSVFDVKSTYRGIRGLVLSASDRSRYMRSRFECSVDEASAWTSMSIKSATPGEDRSVSEAFDAGVRALTAPIFDLFNFFEMGDKWRREAIGVFLKNVGLTLRAG